MPRKPRTEELIPVPLAFAKTMRELRLDVGIAQEKLAQEANICRSYVSGLERGKHSPTLDMIVKLLMTMDVSFVAFAIVFERELKCSMGKSVIGRKAAGGAPK